MAGAVSDYYQYTGGSTIFSASARRMAASVPAPENSATVAGYAQECCRDDPYPVYVEISGTITVPSATYITGTPGISSDYFMLGGVTAGLSVDNSSGQAFYVANGQRGTAPVTALDVKPGDKLQVTIERK